MTASYAYVGERLRCETLNSNPNDFGKEWNVVGIAANATSIALCTSNVWHRLGHQVFLYSVTDGAVLHSFGSKGLAQDQLQGPVSIRFSPDDYHLLIVDIVSNRLSLFTFAGEFVRCIGVGVLKRPTDAVFAHNGDIIVADCGNRRLCAFSPDGDTLLHTLMFPWPDTRSFRSPFSLAVHRRLLYVLDTDRDTVHVIEYK